MPLDPSANIGVEFKNMTVNAVYANKKYSKTSFILLNDGQGYQAYLMVIMADPNYINNDLAKLSRNTYRKLDTAFTGVILYFKPDGRYTNGYKYSHGKIVVPASADAGNGQVLSLKQGATKQSTDGLNTQSSTSCTDYYLITYYDDGSTESEYIGTVCNTCAQESTAGCPTGGTSGGGSSGTTTVDIPAATCGSTSSGGGSTGNRAIGIDKQPAPGTGDGGAGSPNDPCTTTGSTSTGIFGINDSNAEVPDGNFDNLLNYVQNIGYSVTDPFSTILTTNDGVSYTGQMTEIYDTSVSPPKLIASYFSPDVSSGPFAIGMEYNIGSNEEAGSNSTTIIINSGNVTYEGINFGSPVANIGNSASKIVYTGGSISNTVVVDSESEPNISDTDPDVAWWNDNTTSYASQKLPSWANMFANYPKNSSGADSPGPQVYTLVGGAVLAAYNSSPANYQNACALRVSRALNYSGVVIPQISGQTYKGNDNKNYFLSSAKLYNFMKKTFGNGSIVLSQKDGGPNGQLFQSKLAGHKGIYIMQASFPSQFGALGHATLFDGVDCIGGHNYFNAEGGVDKITLWILN